MSRIMIRYHQTPECKLTCNVFHVPFKSRYYVLSNQNFQSTFPSMVSQSTVGPRSSLSSQTYTQIFHLCRAQEYAVPGDLLLGRFWCTSCKHEDFWRCHEKTCGYSETLNLYNISYRCHADTWLYLYVSYLMFYTPCHKFYILNLWIGC